MSKNISIEEGDRSRNFGPTSKIKTELQGGGECYWVPEDERLTAYVFASKNREYTAENISAYGIGEIDVNVIYAGVDPNGNPWYVYIDPNTGMPVIEYPEAKVTDFDIKFPSGIAAVDAGDDEYILVEVDTGEQIRVDKITGEIITVDPKYEDTEGSYPINVDPITGRPYIKDPETGEPFVDGDGNPINPITGNPIEIEDIQTGDNPAGVTITINPETGFPIVENPITGEPIAEFNDEMMGDMEIDPTSDVDFSMDDMGDIYIVGDIDGIPSVIDLDLDDMEWEKEDCPASIQVMHVPNKTSYEDGEAIDLDGLVIQAYDANGSPWSSSKYPDGYIPAHDLNTSQKYADYNSGSTEYDFPDYSGNISSITSNGSISQLINDETSSHAEEVDEEHRESYDESSQGIIGDLPSGSDGSVGYVWSRELPETIGSGYTIYPVLTIFLFDPLPAQVQPNIAYPGTKYEYRFHWSYTGEASYWGPFESRISRYLFQGEKDGEKSTINMTDTGRKTNKYDVSWTSPCFETFNSSFNYSVNPPSDHGGSHHSGKF